MLNNKLEEMLTTAKLNELLHRKEIEEKHKTGIITVLAIIGAVAAIAGIAYAVYRYLTPDYDIDDFDVDFDNGFDDDFVTLGADEV